MEPVRFLNHAGCKIRLFLDDTAENPIQEYDEQAQVQVWHRSYDFGNDHTFSSPREAREFFQERHDEVAFLPVYLYDHSGLTVNTTGFSCPWDSGQVGYVWCPLDYAEKVMGTRDRDEVEAFLRATIKLLDDYLTGNVYGYDVLDHHGEVVDSCWGFYGDPETSGLLDEAKAVAEHHQKKVQKEAAASMEYAI